MTMNELIQLLTDARDNPRHEAGGDSQATLARWNAQLGKTETFDFSHVNFPPISTSGPEFLVCTSELSREARAS